ncbi:hypothetical protein Tco_1009400 [Tanacetum coccineum]
MKECKERGLPPTDLKPAPSTNRILQEEDLEVEGLKAEIMTLQQGRSSTQYLKVDDGKRIGRVKLQGARQLGTSTPRWLFSCQRIGRYELCEGVGRGVVVDGIVP